MSRTANSTSHMTLSWMVALAVLAELKRDEFVDGRQFHTLYNLKAEHVGFDQLSAQTISALLETMRKCGLVERTPSKGQGSQRHVRATQVGMARLEQARILLDDYEGRAM